MSNPWPRPLARALGHVWNWWGTRGRSRLPIVFSETAPLDLRIAGRMLFHAALVGSAAGLMGASFFAGLEYVQRLLLEDLAGYLPLRASGETFLHAASLHPFRPWVLVLLLAAGGLGCGLLTRFVPEARGGGTDVMIDAFHHQAGVIRRRVIWVKWLASLCTLGTGGAGGREGPTMLMGGALGSLVARILRVSTRERRILLVAGVAAGISAVFRTPLGAALLAVDVLYRDGFESDALIPSVLASVIAYSIVISIFGESTLFAHAPRFPFVPAHLPLYILLSLGVALVATLFVQVYANTKSLFARLRMPAWLKPALGGLILGLLGVPIIVYVGNSIHQPGQGLGILSGGYGAVQMAISGLSWLPQGWNGVLLLLLLCLVKLVASSITIGSGGSAGDFAPSLAIGGLFGGAFGRAAQLLLHDPRIDPGAFALVGMGVFYGGIAHVPLSALVLVCELAGNYDLLVPLMLAQGIAFITLRGRVLYDAQVPTQRDSPVHRDAILLDVLKAFRVQDLMTKTVPFVTLRLQTPALQMLDHLRESTWQEIFPVVDDKGKLMGLVSSDALRVLAVEQQDTAWLVAADIMQPPVTLTPTSDVRAASELMIASGLRELPIVDQAQQVIGFLDEKEIAGAYLRAAARAEEPGA
jgi:CIC family chloride channel protein